MGHVGTQLSGLVPIFRQLFRCVAWLRDVVEKVHLVPGLSPNAGVKCLACLCLISAASLLANLREGRRYSLPTHSRRHGCPPAGVGARQPADSAATKPLFSMIPARLPGVWLRCHSLHAGHPESCGRAAEPCQHNGVLAGRLTSPSAQVFSRKVPA